MLAATIIAAATHALTLGHPGTSAVYASPLRRSGDVVAQLSWDRAPELLALKDILMEASVKHQIEHFQDLNDGGLVLWLSSAWEAFNMGDVSSSSLDEASGAAAAHFPGKMEQFMDQLMRSGHEYFFVPTRALRQGTPSNPYLQQRANMGYQIEVEPAQIAQRLMACREQLADEWREDLAGLASGCEAERLPHMQRLVGLATRVALRSMLHDLALLPSQAAAHDYLENFMAFHSDALDPNGDADVLLAELERRPLYVSGKSFIDPPQIAADLRLMRQEIAGAMAETLACTSDAHREIKAGFLEACFNKVDGDCLSGDDSCGNHLPGVV